jgi:hypothetical protein
MKRLWTLLVAATLALCFSVGQAAAEESDPGAAQAAGQSAASGQEADGSGDAYQGGATNRTFDIRVLSPGSSGDVTQSNSTTAVGIAANDNDTKQSVDQSQTGGGSGSDYTQVAGQEAKSTQDADADATAKQIAPTNEASSIRVLSPGNNGDVNQSNSATAGAVAANDNDTKQDTDQTQAGGGSGSDYTQIAGQAAANHQNADADATAVQLHPSNTAGSIRVLSPGDDGDVTQSNSTTAVAAGLNDNETKQSIDQSQGSAAAPAKTSEPYAKEKDGKSKGSDYTQVAGQESTSKQKADADATAVQVKPSNTAGSIRVLSPGDGGNVTQSNDATAVGIAKNDNETKQSIDQTQPGGYGSDYTQIAGQKAKNEQKADADATAVQIKPQNTAGSIRVLSPGDDGDVDQSNSTTAIAAGLNENETKQSIDQTQGSASKEKAPEAKERTVEDGHMDKGGSYTQIAGQEADNEQKADADATAVQWKPSNTTGSIRVLSPGDGGDVTQSNDATAVGIAKNDNETKQSIDQTQGSGSMAAKAPESEDAKKDGYSDKGSSYTQIAGQKADSDQKAFADATAVQIKPSNENSSVRVGSKGDDGDVTQSNDATALGIAKNDNETKQSIDQVQGGGSGSDYLQVAGQEAKNDQKADADAFALQVKPSNENAPVRVLSKGDDGDVSQSNSTTAIAAALNDNDTKQSIDQIQGGGRGHGSDYVQVAGQGSWNRQKADADATAIQLGASNENAPVRVLSPNHGRKKGDHGRKKGDHGREMGGSVEQSNDVTALAVGLNANETRQYLDQRQAGSGPLYLQVGGQGSWTDQRAGAMTLGLQGGMKKKNTRK